MRPLRKQKLAKNPQSPPRSQASESLVVQEEVRRLKERILRFLEQNPSHVKKAAMILDRWLNGSTPKSKR